MNLPPIDEHESQSFDKLIEDISPKKTLTLPRLDILAALTWMLVWTGWVPLYFRSTRSGSIFQYGFGLAHKFHLRKII